MDRTFWRPPVTVTGAGDERLTGFEIEFGNTSVADTAQALQRKLGGELTEINPFVMELSGLPVGTLRIERDADLLNKVHYRQYLEKFSVEFDEGSLAREIEQGVDRLSSNLIPCEIITDPLRFDQFDYLHKVVEVLNGLAATGTRDSLVNAFGTHLNPDVPELTAPVIRDYLQAFLLLYDWIVRDSKTDFSRRYLTSFIDPFPATYLRKVLTTTYDPDEKTLIRDYLKDNPTRNRALDLLPMLCEVDETLVMAGVKSAEQRLIKKRPTFHYRLPDCRLGDDTWSIADEWNRWWYVEMIANDESLRHRLIRSWRRSTATPRLPFDDAWARQVERFLKAEVTPPHG